MAILTKRRICTGSDDCAHRETPLPTNSWLYSGRADFTQEEMTLSLERVLPIFSERRRKEKGMKTKKRAEVYGIMEMVYSQSI
jgi:hypothetical protein